MGADPNESPTIIVKTMWKVLLQSCLLCICVLSSTSCALHAYRVLSVDAHDYVPANSSQKNSIIYFNVPQLFEEHRTDPRQDMMDAQLLAKFFEKSLTQNPTFAKAVLISSPPEQGLYVAITVRGEDHYSLSSAFYLLASSCTLTVLPLYLDDVAQYVIHYQLFKDGIPVKDYEHRLQKKSLIWIGALFAAPFWLSPPWDIPKERVFSETAQLFWTDGQRDRMF